jgi:putative Mn2+ efflux pump MntP
MFASGASLALLALAVSLDGFGVGASYGIRGIRIPALSVFIIAACSGAVVWMAMAAGGWLTAVLPRAVAQSAGAVLLIAVGLWALAQLGRGTDAGADREPGDGAEGCAGAPEAAGSGDAAMHDPAPEDSGASARHTDSPSLRSVIRIELRRLGLVICVLRAPQAADMDRSGTISASEAVLLGVALSLDALGAGFGAAMVGFPALPSSLLIAAASGMFLLAGLRFGRRFAVRFGGSKAVSVLPGLILIATGIARLMDL